ncbi:MAG: hypothetical protein KU28_01895 [Sulfurovum sp. PC08-66]|nr:MAG: hypothetical protein KU28_01895 [Sulfurovum sp. PC08-66]KIM12683.1 MAG: hypothetical protein KU37_02000 [Sulfuricurvum sp. PC08-66]
MKELKILAIVVIVTALTYIGIEPLAHMVMHPHVEPADYSFGDLKELKNADGTAVAQGNIENGKLLVGQNCKACHTLKADGYEHIASKEELMAKYGTIVDVEKHYDELDNRYVAEMYNSAVPLDLSNAATIFDPKFLSNFIKDPSNAAFDSTYKMHKEHQMHLDLAKLKNDEEKAKLQASVAAEIESFRNKPKIAMPAFDYLSDQEIADIVAYLTSIKQPLDGRESLVLACGRCHNMQYANIEATTPADLLKKYLGTTPPDLSMMIRSKGEHYLTVFVNDPQKVLIGSSMPRVGVTRETESKIVGYLEEVGDSKKEERESLGVWVIGYFVIFAVLAYFFKRHIWRELH